MRKLVTGFIAGILVTLVAMFAILGDGEDSAVLPAENVSGQASDSVIADPQAVEQRRRAVRAGSSASATDARELSNEGDAFGSDDSVSENCCTIVIASGAADSADIDESIAVPIAVHPASDTAPSRPFLAGKWEGVMTGVGAQPDGSPSIVPPFDEARGQFGFRLDIRETNLVMYFQNGDQWVGLGEGQDLRTNELGRSAVVTTALNAANGGIEVLVLNIVRWNEETIAVHMSRVTGAGPNGDSLPPPMSAMGILNRAVF